jgi:hypothetical protein
MDILVTSCPSCDGFLEFPRNLDNVVCGVCGSTYLVSVSRGTVNLTLIPDSGGAPADPRLQALDERIQEIGESIEELKAREQGAPLQIGCALFGLFGLVVAVMAFFATVAAGIFRTWLFILAVIAVLALGIRGMKRRLPNRSQLQRQREERLELERELAELEEERNDLLRMSGRLQD